MKMNKIHKIIQKMKEIKIPKEIEINLIQKNLKEKKKDKVKVLYHIKSKDKEKK